jgi:hypothetical protein
VVWLALAELAEPDRGQQAVILEALELGSAQYPGRVVVGEIPGPAASAEVQTPSGGQEVFQRARG